MMGDIQTIAISAGCGTIAGFLLGVVIFLTRLASVFWRQYFTCKNEGNLK